MQTRNHSSERGAIIVHVAFCLLAVTAFSAVAVDYGVLLISRRQAQNAADASALAGATALAFQDFDDRSDTGPAKVSAVNAGRANAVWGAEPSIEAATDVSFIDDDKIRADLYRGGKDKANAANRKGNDLPTFFAQLVGVNRQGVRATATAQVLMANSSECVKPWAIAETFTKIRPCVGQQCREYWKYGKLGPIPPPHDVYQPSGPVTTGTGFTITEPDGTPVHYGLQLALKFGDANRIYPGWAREIDIPDRNAVVNYSLNITQCNGASIPIADEGNLCTAVNPAAGCVQSRPGVYVPDRAATLASVRALRDQDPDAFWDRTGNNGRGAVKNSDYPVSPRQVVVPVFDIEEYEKKAFRWNDTNGRMRIVKQIGFFVEAMCEDLSAAAKETYMTCTTGDLVGRVTIHSGIRTSDSDRIVRRASFLRTIQLIR